MESGVLDAKRGYIRNFFENEPEKVGAHPASSLISSQSMGDRLATSQTCHKPRHYRQVATEETPLKSGCHCDLVKIQASEFHRQ